MSVGRAGWGFGGQLPWCAVCDKEVDRFERYHSVSSDEIQFIAYCHGQRQDVWLAEEVLAFGAGVYLGLAFEVPLLPPSDTKALAP